MVSGGNNNSALIIRNISQSDGQERFDGTLVKVNVQVSDWFIVLTKTLGNFSRYFSLRKIFSVGGNAS